MDEPSGSLWEATSPPPRPRSALPGDTSCDVAIVGAGYTGLWTAYHLARGDPRLRVLVVEANHVGFGASGRNGGWCSAKVSGIETLLRDPFTRSGAIALQREMFRTVEAVGRFVTDEGVACGFRRGGTVVVARGPVQVDRLTHGIAVRRQAGFGEEDFRWLAPREVRERIRTDRVLGGTFTPHCAVVHPLALVRGIADAAERRGVVIHEGTRVTRLAPGRVTTDHGTVRAEVIVRATEAYTARLPGLRREVTPVYSLMIATAPLDDTTWQAIGLAGGETFSDGRRLVIYGQRTADGRLAFGGRGAPYHFGSRIADRFDREPGVFARLATTLHELLPDLPPVPITHRWGGPLAITRDWIPEVILDRDTGIAWAGGYGGQGVATAELAGRILTDLVLGRDSDLLGLPLVGHRARPWEPEPLRWLGINAGIHLTAGTDRAEERRGRPARLRGAVLKRLVGL